MPESEKPPENLSVSAWKAVVGIGLSKRGRMRKYAHYLFITAALVIVLSALALLNAYFRFYNVSSYSTSQQGVSSSIALAGYLGMFLTMWISPIPDYVLVPVYGYLSAIGLFNPYTTFVVCVIAAILPIEYAAGRLAARALLLKVLSYIRITEKDIEVADKWLINHGKFSIFISTFIPFFYSVASLAAGTLKMNWVAFILLSTTGFALRYAFLEYVGYYGIYVFTSSFDYSQRFLFFALLVVSIAYVALYLVGTLKPLVNKPTVSSQH